MYLKPYTQLSEVLLQKQESYDNLRMLYSMLSHIIKVKKNWEFEWDYVHEVELCVTPRLTPLLSPALSELSSHPSHCTHDTNEKNEKNLKFSSYCNCHVQQRQYSARNGHTGVIMKFIHNLEYSSPKSSCHLSMCSSYGCCSMCRATTSILFTYRIGY